MERLSGILDIMYTASQEVRKIHDWGGIEEEQDCPHHSLESEILPGIAWLDTSECLLKDLDVELINSRLSLFNGTCQGAIFHFSNFDF